MTSRLALFLGFCILVGCTQQDPEEPGAAEAHEEGEEETEELAHHMAYVQRYAEKLYFAGMADNTPLAQFYIEELEETFEAIGDGGYVENEHAVADLVEEVAMSAIEGMEHAVAAQALGSDADRARAIFSGRYAQLVQACNACHQSTGHGYVHIIVPEMNSFPNQQFTPTMAPEPSAE